MELTDILEVGYNDFIPEPLGVGPEYERSIDAPGDTVVVKQPSAIQQPQQLRTPEATPEPTQFPDAADVPDASTSQPSPISGPLYPSRDGLTERPQPPDDLTVDPGNDSSNDSLSTEASASYDIPQSAESSSALTYPKKPTQPVTADLLQEYIQTGKRIRK